jgi:hypothetical protein
MPGLWGAVGPTVSGPGIDASVRVSGLEVLERNSGVILGHTARALGPRAISHCRSGDVAVLLYGHCLERGRGVLDAARFLELWVQTGSGFLSTVEGAFLASVYEAKRGRLSVLNDRVGILPLYWHAQGTRFTFGARMRYLLRESSAWTPDPGAVTCFLSVGHYLGPSTQVKEARFLTPATILEVDTRTAEVTERRYWNLVYDPDTSASTAEHRDRLADAIAGAVDLLNPEGSRPGIFLSGGWDSRAILGAMLASGRKPQLVITNGRADDIPQSDTWMAKRMATDLGLPYRFCRRDPKAGEALWLDGIHSGEITTANNPESFGLHRLPQETFAEVDFMMKGDVTWGSGDRAPTRELSIAKIIPYPLMQKVKDVLHPDVAAESDRLYEAQVDGVMRHCRNEGWTERRDYLWQMGGINRYILGLGISDEEHVQVRRPLLSGMVLDVYTKVPGNLRVLKNLFIETIAHRYPQLFAYGRNHVSNIAYYYAYMAPFVRRRALAHLDAGHDLGGLLNRDACRRVIEAFGPVEPPTWIPGIKTRVYNRLHDRYSHLWHRTRFYGEKHPKRFETSDTMLAFHIYLLLEWFHGSPE